MGFHSWTEQCPYCGFEEMNISSDGVSYFEVICPVCGYVKWVEEKLPGSHDIEIAKQTLCKMDAERKQKAIELYYEDNLPLIKRLKNLDKK